MHNPKSNSWNKSNCFLWSMSPNKQSDRPRACLCACVCEQTDNQHQLTTEGPRGLHGLWKSWDFSSPTQRNEFHTNHKQLGNTLSCLMLCASKSSWFCLGLTRFLRRKRLMNQACVAHVYREKYLRDPAAGIDPSG